MHLKQSRKKPDIQYLKISYRILHPKNDLKNIYNRNIFFKCGTKNGMNKIHANYLKSKPQFDYGYLRTIEI